MHSSRFFQIKLIARLILKCEISRSHMISDQSLLLSTIVLNDYSFCCLACPTFAMLLLMHTHIYRPAEHKWIHIHIHRNTDYIIHVHIQPHPHTITHTTHKNKQTTHAMYSLVAFLCSYILTKMYSDSNIVVNIITIASNCDTALVSTKSISCY